MATFNLSSRKLEETCVMQLTDPATEAYLFADDAETEAVSIVLYGRSSKQYRNYMAAQIRKAEAQKNSKKTKSLDEMLDENAEFLAAVSVSSAHLEFEYDDKAIKPQSKEDFKKLYMSPELSWIGDQVTEYMNTLGNFVKK